MRLAILAGLMLGLAISESKGGEPASLQPIYDAMDDAIAASEGWSALQPLYDLCDGKHCKCDSELCDCEGGDLCRCNERTCTPKFERKETKESAELNRTLEAILSRLDEIESSCVKVQGGIVKPTIPKAESPSGYPVNHRADWLEKVNGRMVPWTRQARIAHLTEGEHRGKFPLSWLSRLSDDELRSLHADDHEHRVQWSYVPGFASLEIDGKHAMYRAEPYTVKEQVCDGRGHCTYRDVTRVRLVPLGWK